MSQTKHEILALLAQAGTEPRHRFGQNFMIDQNLVRIVADAGRIEPGDLVMEVGPGTGALADELLERVSPGGRVVAVEIDRDLAGLLRTRFAGRDDFTLIEGDALAGKHQLNPELLAALRFESIDGVNSPLSPPSVLRGRAEDHETSGQLTPSPSTPGEGRDPFSVKASEDPHPNPLPEYRERGPEGEPGVAADVDGSTRESAPALPDGAERWKLVANLPYNIASPLVIELLMAGVSLLAFTVQKEVADRFKAPAGSDDYGPLSVMAQLLGRMRVLRTLPPQAFWPAPKIDSALVCIARDDRLGRHANGFSTFVHKLFSYRRKTLRKAIAEAGYDAVVLLAATGFDGRLAGSVHAGAAFGLVFGGWFTPLDRARLMLANHSPTATRFGLFGGGPPVLQARPESTGSEAAVKFNLIDKVESLSDDRIVAVKYVSLAEEYLADHFPTFPVLPGVMMLEAVTQAAGWLLHRRHDFARSMAVLKEARNVKYGRFVAPGNFLRVDVELFKLTDSGAVFKAIGSVGQGSSGAAVPTPDAQALSARIEMAYFNLGDKQPKQPELADIDGRLRDHNRRRWDVLRQASVGL